MRRAILVMYVAMAAYLILGSAGRVALMVNGGQDPDLLPFAATILGIVALVLLVPGWGLWDKDE